MAKYHISPKTGRPNQCTAKSKCPLGGEADHYATREEAKNAIEAKAAATYETVAKPLKKEPPRDSKGNIDLNALPEAAKSELYDMLQERLELQEKRAEEAAIMKKRIKTAGAFDEENFREQLHYRSGIDVPDYHPGCPGCTGEDRYDYCRCRTYRDEVRIDRKELTDSYYREITNIPWNHKYDEVDEKIKTIIYQTFDKHGLFNNYNYEPEITGGYYGQELIGMTSTANIGGAMKELQDIFNSG